MPCREENKLAAGEQKESWFIPIWEMNFQAPGVHRSGQRVSYRNSYDWFISIALDLTTFEFAAKQIGCVTDTEHPATGGAEG